MDFLLRRLYDKKQDPKMLQPAAACFTGGGPILVALPEALQQSLRSGSALPHFSLVFEGTGRRHVSSCCLIDDAFVSAAIPEHQERTESLDLLLYQRCPEGLTHQLISRHTFRFEAPDPFAALAALLVRLSVRCDQSFPASWAALIATLDVPTVEADASAFPTSSPTASRDRVRALVKSLASTLDPRLAKALGRYCVSAQAKDSFERLRSDSEKDLSPFAGLTTVLHFLAKEGLIESCCCLLRHSRAHRLWAVADVEGHTPADLADRAGFTEFSLLLRCPKSMEKWLETSAEAQQRSTSGDSVASVSHHNQRLVVLTTNKEKSNMSIPQDLLIHEAVVASETEAENNARRRMALNGGVADSPTTSGLEPEELERLASEVSSLPAGFGEASASGDEGERDVVTATQTNAKLVHNTDTVDYALAADHPPGSPFVLRSNFSSATGDASLGPLGCSADDLKDQGPSWSVHLGREVRRSFTRNFLKRQDLIWELIATERNYVRLLQAVHEVYEQHFLRDLLPSPSSATDTVEFTAKQAERLFPCIRRLASIHGRFLHRLCERQRSREDRSIIELSDLLLMQFEGDYAQELVEVYGEFYARHRQGKTLLEDLRQRSPRFRAYLAKCEAQPSIQRRKLDDCYLIINQRFSKVESLLVTIAENTINQEEEAAKLSRALKSLKDVTFRAEAMLGATQNREMQEQIFECFDPKSHARVTPDLLFSRDDLDPKRRKVLHFGKLKIIRSGFRADSKVALGASKSTHAECLGVLFTDMLVLLQEAEPGSKRFQFLKEEGFAPSVLPFDRIRSCIFRESPQRQQNEFEFYVIFTLNDMSLRYSLYTSLSDDRAKWVKLLTATYMDTETKVADDLEQAYDERRSDIQKRFQAGKEVLTQMSFADWEIERLVTIKAALWQEYLSVWELSELEDAVLAGTLDSEGNEGTGQSVREEATSDSPRSTTPGEEEDVTDSFASDQPLPDIEGLMKRFAQEATKLHMLIHSCNANLTRSASSAADQALAGRLGPSATGAGSRGRGNSYGGNGGNNLPRRVETFAGYDKYNTSGAKMTAGMYGKRPSLEASASEESVSTTNSERAPGPSSAKSESTLKVKDSSRRRSSLNFANIPSILRNLGKATSGSSSPSGAGEKSAAVSLQRNASAPLSPLSTTSTGTPASPASPAESGGGGGAASTPGCSSYYNWSNDTVNWGELQSAVGPPNRQAVLSLTYMNAQTRRLISGLSRLRTQLAQLHNRSTRAEREAATLRAQLHAREHGNWAASPTGPTAPPANEPSGSGTSSGAAVHVMTEKLRNQRAELERERADFAKWRDQQRARLEGDRESLERKRAELDDEKTTLEVRKKRHEEKECNLQKLIYHHERRLQVSLDPNNVDQQKLLFPDVSTGHARCHSDDNSGAARASVASLRRESLGGGGSRHLAPQPGGTASTSLLALSQVTRSTSDLTPSLATSPPAGSAGTLHVLPMSLAEGEKGHGAKGGAKGKLKRSSIFRHKK